MRYAMLRAVVLLIGLGYAVTGVGQTQAVATRQTVPAGTQILIRMVNSVDSSKQQVGYRFTANLETNLQAGEIVVAPRGSTVYGRLANAKSAGNMSGGAELTLELTEIVINGTAYPLLTSTYRVASQGQGSNTAKKIVGGTGLGALIGGIAGGGKGAAIGAGAGAAVGTTASAASKGKQVSVPSESLLEFRLQQPVSLPVARSTAAFPGQDLRVVADIRAIFREGDGSAWSRVGYSITRGLVTRADSGQSQPNWSNIFASLLPRAYQICTIRPRIVTRI